MTDAENEFLGFVADVLGVPAASVSMDTAYESIPEWDSEIPVDEIALIRTLGGFYRYVASK